jgi:hypothetical protein
MCERFEIRAGAHCCRNGMRALLLRAATTGQKGFERWQTKLKQRVENKVGVATRA